MNDAYKIGVLVGRSQGESHIYDLEVDERIILKLKLEKWRVKL
jgi:hypothetical protein